MRAHEGLADELCSVLDRSLPVPIRRMHVTGDDQLHRPYRIGKDALKPIRIVEEGHSASSPA